MNRALILVDMQNDYFSGGSMELVGMERAAQHARDVLTCFRERGAPVIHLQHESIRPGASFFLPGTPGIEINETVQPARGEAVVKKHYPNGFRDTELLDRLREQGVDELVICGAMTHMCIDATTRAAFDHGFGCTVIHDACATRDLAFEGTPLPAAQVHSAFMAALSVPYARILSAGSFLAGE